MENKDYYLLNLQEVWQFSRKYEETTKTWQWCKKFDDFIENTKKNNNNNGFGYLHYERKSKENITIHTKRISVDEIISISRTHRFIFKEIFSTTLIALTDITWDSRYTIHWNKCENRINMVIDWHWHIYGGISLNFFTYLHIGTTSQQSYTQFRF